MQIDTDEVRGCCYELLALNIVVDKVEPIIRSVLRKKTLYIKRLRNFQVMLSLFQMIIECLTIAQAQLAEKLLKT